MSQALELLNSLTNDDISRLLAQAEEEGHIVIGSDRFITVPANLKRIAVQHDHNVETVTFDCPRYWDDVDLSKLTIYIIYKLADGYKDRYPADNVRVDGDIIHFDWTISKNVTQVAGRIVFLVCAVSTDAEGNEEHHWNSEPNQDMYVSEGLECDSYEIITDPDLVTQLLSRMNSVKQINVQAEEMRELHDETVDSAAFVADESNHIKNSYASAIKGSASGEIIQVNDVSPIDHDVECWVHGKNVFNGELTDGIIRTINFDVDAGNGVYKSIMATLPKGTYTVSFSTAVNIVRSVINGVYRVVNDQMGVSKFTFTHAQEGCVGITFRDAISSDTVWNSENTIQIECGSEATEYEPHVDPSTVSIKRFGKNLLDHTIMQNNYFLNGVTITRVDDQLKINGTLTTDSVLFNSTFHFHGGVGNYYTLSYEYLGGTVSGSSSICVGSRESADASRQSWLNITMNQSSNAFTHSLSMPYVKDMWFYAKAGATFTDYRIRIQLELGKNVTEYETSKVSEHTPAADGFVSVASASPNMMIVCDTPGVTVEAEYNRDTNKAFDSGGGSIDTSDFIKVSALGAYKVPYTDGDGTLQNNFNWTSNASPWTFPVRREGGQIMVGDPTFDGAATPKSYVDNLIGDIENVVDSIVTIQNALIGGADK